MVYLLSTKLQKKVINDQLGADLELNLIHYITRFGYGMRRGPHVTIHGAYSRYTTLPDTTNYIQGCFDNVNRVIPVTIFMMMLFIRSLTVSRSAVGVPALQGKCTLLPPATNLVRFSSSIFSGRMRMVMRPYVTSFARSQGTWCLWMNIIVLVPVLRPCMPCASRPISFPYE